MKCVIIEDELPAQQILKNYISKLPYLNLVGSFQGALEANSILRENEIDVVFLDINLPYISGIDYIKTLSKPPKIIMTTAYPNYAAESFELDTIHDYLVKPFSFERFLKSINKIERIEPQTKILKSDTTDKKILFLNIDKTLHKIFIEDLVYIESDRNYITIASENQKWSYVDALKNWNSKLPADTFTQIHKSFIINFKRIDKVVGNTIYIGEKKFPIGRLYKEAFMRKLKA